MAGSRGGAADLHGVNQSRGGIITHKFQDILDRELGRVPYRLLAETASRKLGDQGIHLSGREFERLVSYLESGGNGELKLAWRPFIKNAELTLAEEDVDLAEERLTDFLSNRLPETFQTIADEAAVPVLKTLRKTWPAQARYQRHLRRGFNQQLRRRWAKGIDLLRMMLTISRELGESINSQLRSQTHHKQPHLVDALTRLHARACQVTEEVVCLLSDGLADGAMARWRTLHEISTVASLLCKHGEQLAERYVDHQVVESYKATQDYRACSGKLGYEPMTNEEFQEVTQTYESVCSKHGSGFSDQYGWALPALDTKRSSVQAIERAAGLDHLRAHYRMASHNVHANPKGVYFRLGLINERHILLAGPSDAGLADPGDCTAISLLQVTAALNTVYCNLDSLVALKILQWLSHEIGDAFSQANGKLSGKPG